MFDKTGILTTGQMALVAVVFADGVTSDDLLATAAGAEAHSEHPIGRAIVAGHTVVVCGWDGQVRGALAVADTVRPAAAAAP